MCIIGITAKKRTHLSIERETSLVRRHAFMTFRESKHVYLEDD